MNERQYHWLCNNRRARYPLGLDQLTPREEARRRWRGQGVGSALGTVVSRAAKELRQRQAAAVAWQSVAQPEWLPETAVDSVQKGTLIVAVSGSAVYGELSRRRATLQRGIARLVPGVQRLRFMVAGERVSWGVEEGVGRAGDPEVGDAGG